MLPSLLGSRLDAEYHGSSRTTQSCLDAITRLLASGIQITKALLLTANDRHAFYFEVDGPAPIFIRCGFTSGYTGAGPMGLAVALQLARSFALDVEEVVVDLALLHRVDMALLKEEDLETINESAVVRPIRIYDYIHASLGYVRQGGPPLAQFRHSIPWSLLDDRLLDIALSLPRDGDRAVFTAYRMLEERLKDRCGLPIDSHGGHLIKKVFADKDSLLLWRGISAGEAEGRAQMFVAAFKAHRNPRAHREVEGGANRAYREFYVVNELFLMEREAVLRDSA